MVNQLETGQAVVDLGGEVYKVRLARSGSGKSGGYRVIVFFRSSDKIFYYYGFAKSVRANINQKELKAHKEAAKEFFALTNTQIKERLERSTLYEII
jgi:hypothetical protein